MPNNKTVRRDYIDIMKGLGILLVVLGHFMDCLLYTSRCV